MVSDIPGCPVLPGLPKGEWFGSGWEEFVEDWGREKTGERDSGFPQTRPGTLRARGAKCTHNLTEQRVPLAPPPPLPGGV